MRWNNCLLWAWWKWHRKVWEWRRAGGTKGFEPAMVIRPSRSDPWWIPHFLVSYEIKEMQYGNLSDLPGELVSFKPENPTDVPVWLAWTHFLFKGKVRVGDFPDTKPEKRDEGK